jgi:uncharacterized protein (TIGR03086 family)
MTKIPLLETDWVGTPGQSSTNHDEEATMGEIGERYRRVAGDFTDRATQVPADGWDRPAPCEGWVARDVVAHLVEWIPSFVESAGGPSLPTEPPVEVDPAGSWIALSDGIQALLDDPAACAVELHHPYAGTHRFDDAIATFVTGDVLVHTWDLARAAGLDERLDPAAVHDVLAGMAGMDDALRTSGHFGPRVDVAPDADEQTRLIAFTGRHP